MDNIKLFVTSEKELETLIHALSPDIRIEFGIENCAMLMKKKREMTHDKRNRITKSRKNQNARRKGNLLILGNIGS